MKGTKRILSLALSLALVFALLPVTTVWAAPHCPMESRKRSISYEDLPGLHCQHQTQNKS